MVELNKTGDVTLSPIPTMDQASMFKALEEGYTSLNAKAAISTNAVNKYIDFYKNSKVQGICNTDTPLSPASAIKASKEFIEVDSCQQSSTVETVWGRIVNFFKKVYDFLFGWIKWA
jgi:viroplasmin and RNaseH domain-containing protein